MVTCTYCIHIINLTNASLGFCCYYLHSMVLGQKRSFLTSDRPSRGGTHISAKDRGDLKWKGAWREWTALHVQAECTIPKPVDSETNTERGSPLDTNFGVRCDQSTEKEAQMLASGHHSSSPCKAASSLNWTERRRLQLPLATHQVLLMQHLPF